MPTLFEQTANTLAQIGRGAENRAATSRVFFDATIFLADKSDFAAMNKVLGRVGGGWSRPGALHGGSDADEPAV